jgi:hypothetical protein
LNVITYHVCLYRSNSKTPKKGLLIGLTGFRWSVEWHPSDPWYSLVYRVWPAGSSRVDLYTVFNGARIMRVGYPGVGCGRYSSKIGRIMGLGPGLQGQLPGADLLDEERPHSCDLTRMTRTRHIDGGCTQATPCISAIFIAFDRLLPGVWHPSGRSVGPMTTRPHHPQSYRTRQVVPFPRSGG